MFGERLGLSPRIERLYAAGVVMGTGGWLSAATALGPTVPPLPVMLVGGAIALAAPWWSHRRRRARVRVDQQIAAWPEIARDVGLAGSRAQSAVVVDVWGWRARFALARGQTIQDVIAKVPAIESALGTFRGAVRVAPTRTGKANRFELRCSTETRTPMRSRDRDRPSRPLPNRSTSARSRTRPARVFCCCDVTASSVAWPAPGRAAGLTSWWATSARAGMSLSGRSTSSVGWSSRRGRPVSIGSPPHRSKPAPCCATPSPSWKRVPDGSRPMGGACGI